MGSVVKRWRYALILAAAVEASVGTAVAAVVVACGRERKAVLVFVLCTAAVALSDLVLVPGWVWTPRPPVGFRLLVRALLAAVAPLMRAERFRSGAAGIAWPLLCLALLLDFVGLGLLGARPPEGGVIVASQVLTVGWFVFFVLAAPILGRTVRRSERVPGG